MLLISYVLFPQLLSPITSCVYMALFAIPISNHFTILQILSHFLLTPLILHFPLSHSNDDPIKVMS